MNNYGKLKKSIKTKVVFKVSALIAFILTLCISLIIYMSITNLQEKTSLNLNNKSKKLLHDIELRLEFLKENTGQLASNELIINAFVGQKDREKYFMPLINSFKKDKYMNSLSVLDFDGRAIFQTNKDVPNFSNSQELRLSLSLAETIAYLKTKENEIIFIVPIQYYDTTQGAIVATYDLKKIIEKYNKIEDSMYIRFFKNEFEYYSKNYEDDKNYYRYKQLDMMDHAILNNLNITSEIGTIESVYLQPLQTQIAILLVFGVFILAMGVCISYYLATTITNPILELYNRINKISYDDPIKKYVPLNTHDELEELGYAFYKKEKVEFVKNQQEQIIQQQAKMATMGEMIANIAHQWRQPLANLNGLYLNMELDYNSKKLNKKVFDNYLLQMEDTTMYLSKTINDFTGFLKINKEKVEFDITDVLEKSHSMMHRVLNKKKIKLILNIKKNISIKAYPSELMQVIFTIINNSKDAFEGQSIDDKFIRISLCQKDESIFLSFEDNAGGIKKAIFPKIFEPYFTTKEKLQGTGLGLYIAKSVITKSFQGELNVENIKNGVLFTIELPKEHS